MCVTRRKQERPGNAPNDNTAHMPTARSSAEENVSQFTVRDHSTFTCSRKRCQEHTSMFTLNCNVSVNTSRRCKILNSRVPIDCSMFTL